MEKARYLPEAQNDFVWAVITTGSPWPLLAGYLLLINLCTFAAFGIDKWKASHPGRRRIPERNLFLGAIAGGSLGALLGMRVFHHKTRHWYFWAVNFLGLAWQAAALVLLALYA